MTKKQNDISKTYIIIATIIGLAILGYGYMNYSAKMKVLESDKQAKELEIKKEKDNALNLQICLLKADTNKTDYWNKLCKSYGVNHKKDDCSLYQMHIDLVDNYLKNEQDQCYQLYK